MTTVVGYVRVSTARQATHGVSLDAQRERITRWSAANDYPLDGIHADEGVSGKAMENRPGLMAAIDRTLALRGTLVGYSLSRLFRSAREAEETAIRLRDSGCRLVSLTESIDTDSAVGMLIFRVFSAMAQFERELTAERTIAALEYKRSNGGRTGRYAPIGFRFENDKVVPCENEQRAIELARSMVGKSPKAIQRAIRDAGIPGRASDVWSLKTIRKVLA